MAVAKVSTVAEASIGKISTVANASIGKVSTVAMPAGYDPQTGVAWTHAYWAESLGLADGDPIDTWADGPGTADLTASGTARPTYRTTGGANSKPCVDFDGSSDYMNATITAMSQPVTVALIYTYDTNPASGTCQRVLQGSNWYVDTNDPASGRYRINGDVATLGSLAATSTPYLLFMYFNGNGAGASVVELNGEGGLALNWELGTASINSFRLGAATGGGSLFCNIDVMFLGFYAGDARADGGWAAFESWVGSHYAITLV